MWASPPLRHGGGRASLQRWSSANSRAYSVTAQWSSGADSARTRHIDGPAALLPVTSSNRVIRVELERAVHEYCSRVVLYDVPTTVRAEHVAVFTCRECGV